MQEPCGQLALQIGKVRLDYRFCQGSKVLVLLEHSLEYVRYSWTETAAELCGPVARHVLGM